MVRVLMKRPALLRLVLVAKLLLGLFLEVPLSQQFLRQRVGFSKLRVLHLFFDDDQTNADDVDVDVAVGPLAADGGFFQNLQLSLCSSALMGHHLRFLQYLPPLLLLSTSLERTTKQHIAGRSIE